MESTRIASRCLQEVQVSRRTCLRATRRIANRDPRFTNHQITRTTLSSPRTFTTSTRRPQEDASRTSDAQNASSPSPPQTTRPPAMNLSSISSNPNYRAPERGQPPSSNTTSKTRAGTLSALGNLIDKEHARTKAANITAPPRGSRPATGYNEDYYGASGTLARTRSQGPDPAGIMKVLDRSRNRSTPGSLTEGLTEKGDNLRLKPTLGKTVATTPMFDLTRAFQALEGKINGRGNSVRMDERAQKFHVRRGQAKKIKMRERWRIMFKAGFLQECARVRKMIRQGW